MTTAVMMERNAMTMPGMGSTPMTGGAPAMARSRTLRSSSSVGSSWVCGISLPAVSVVAAFAHRMEAATPVAVAATGGAGVHHEHRDVIGALFGGMLDSDLPRHQRFVSFRAAAGRGSFGSG